MPDGPCRSRLPCGTVCAATYTESVTGAFALLHGKTNLSGMKLSYTPKKGTFKGSFKVYALQGSGKGTKLKKYTVKVSGVVVDGVGYGLAVCKKPMLSCPVSIK